MNKLTAMGHSHAEAFCLMQYQCKTCGHLETIWNSRDGVTPFSMRCPSCGNPNQSMGGMYHVGRGRYYVGRDRYAPKHKLHRYQKYWRDMTADEAIHYVEQRYGQLEGTEYEMSKEKRDEWIAKIKEHWGKDNQYDLCSFHKGEPMLDVHIPDNPLLKALEEIQFATKPEPDDGSHHENAYTIATTAIEQHKRCYNED